MFWNSTIYRKRRSFGLLPLPSSRSRHRLCWRTATSSHFWSSTIYTTFHHIHYISQRSNAKNFFWTTGYSVKIRSQVQTITRAILPRHRECIKFTKRAELWTDFWQLDDIFEPPGRNELILWKRTVGFFSLAWHAPTVVWGSRASRA